jgi:hypothetical protein
MHVSPFKEICKRYSTSTKLEKYDNYVDMLTIRTSFTFLAVLNVIDLYPQKHSVTAHIFFLVLVEIYGFQYVI